MTHPLHDYIAECAKKQLDEHTTVVWYDRAGEFAPFVDELRKGASSERLVKAPALGAWLTDYRGSFLELRFLLEPHVAGEQPERALVYVPGVEPNDETSLLLELEKGGKAWKPQLRGLARTLLARTQTRGVVDELLADDRAVSYEDLARAASRATTHEAPSMLRVVLDGVRTDEMFAVFLATAEHDAELVEKRATAELAKLAKATLGLALPEGEGLEKWRKIAARYVLANEFRLDLKCAPPPVLASVDVLPPEHEKRLRDLTSLLREKHADAYETLADAVENELGLDEVEIDALALGAIDTFRFEEAALLGACEAKIAAGEFADALHVATERESSFWLDRDVARTMRWKACRLLAEVGVLATEIARALKKPPATADAWVSAYTAEGGWYRLDEAHRALESWLTKLDKLPDERALGVVRRAYDDTTQAMAKGFADALARAKWSVPGALAQTRVYADLVDKSAEPVAYFLVDAMRYEMAVDLVARLPKGAEVTLRPALAQLPSITPVGMAALLPRAEAGFDVRSETLSSKATLGVRIDGAFLPDSAARVKFFAERVPGALDMRLDALLAESQKEAQFRAKMQGITRVVVRSQEIDAAGEGSFSEAQARQVMNTVLANLVTAMGRLASAGVRRFVLSADHGHLFGSEERGTSMRIDAPGGETVELHRRCWIGRGGATPAGCVRVTGKDLGYAGDLDFVFPVGAGVFKAGGSLLFHHGGPSLQEMVVPALTVRWPAPAEPQAKKSKRRSLDVTDVPAKVTNRVFSVRVALGGAQLAIGEAPLRLKAVLEAGGRNVGKVGVAVDATLDGDLVTLERGKVATLAFLLDDDEANSVAIVLRDAASDLELYRSSPLPVDVQK